MHIFQVKGAIMSVFCVKNGSSGSLISIEIIQSELAISDLFLVVVLV